MKCCGCCHLVDNDKKEGALCGCKYFCKKKGEYVDGSCNGCEDYLKSYSRSIMDQDRIYKEGDIYSDDDRPISYHLSMLVLIVILGVLLSTFGDVGII